MTSPNNFYSVLEPVFTAVLTGLAVSLLISFCQFISERKRRREFRHSWDHSLPPQQIVAAPATTLWHWMTTKTLYQDTEVFPSFPNYFLHRIKRYSFTILFVTFMLVIRWFLEPMLEGRVRFSFFLAAVLLTARTQGIWETLLALILGFLLAIWFFAQPKTLNFFDFHDWWAAGFYLLIGSGIVWILKSEQTAWLRTLTAEISALKRIRESQPAPVHFDQNEQAREMFVQIIENARDAIISISTQGNIKTWNTSAEKLFGWTASEAIGQPLTALLPATQHLELSQTEQDFEPEHLRMTFNARNGDEVYAVTTISPVKDRRRQSIGISLIIRNLEKKAD